MSVKRESLWSRSDGERYMAAAEQAIADETARQEGVYTAQVLPQLWQALTDDERLLIEYLLMIGSTTVAALHNEACVETLVEKGILRRPPGVASVFMQYHATTYEVPPAVWNALNRQRAQFLPYSDLQLMERERAANARLRDRVQVFEPEGSAPAKTAATSASE